MGNGRPTIDCTAAARKLAVAAPARPYIASPRARTPSMKSRRRRSRNAVTLHDVARRARVSPMTVSRVIGAQGNVSDALSARVTAAIEQLGYLPDAAARGLASAGTVRIGLLYGNPSATFTSEFLVDLLENSARVGCQ